jgi:uncharacterized membrane protein YsdA (DUF1294 family)
MPVYCYLVCINIAAFALFGVDKSRAKRQHPQRIPERDLFAVTLLGGSLGALLGMRIFHHKTRHRSFVVGIPCILVLHLVLGGLYLLTRQGIF